MTSEERIAGPHFLSIVISTGEAVDERNLATRIIDLTEDYEGFEIRPDPTQIPLRNPRFFPTRLTDH
jgi:hypothetical protein